MVYGAKRIVRGRRGNRAALTVPLQPAPNVIEFVTRVPTGIRCVTLLLLIIDDRCSSAIMINLFIVIVIYWLICD